MWNPPKDCPVKSYLEKICWVRGLATRILLSGGTEYTKEPTDHPPVANTSAVARYRDNWSVWFLSLSYANRRCVEPRPSWDMGLSHLDLEWPSSVAGSSKTAWQVNVWMRTPLRSITCSVQSSSATPFLHTTHPSIPEQIPGGRLWTLLPFYPGVHCYRDRGGGSLGKAHGHASLKTWEPS